MKPKDWLAFIGLSLAWGSSFFWIKIAVTEIGPFLLVAFRILFGILGLGVVILLRRPAWPKDRRALLTLILLGLTNTAAPFVLISWAEQYIDSAVASILNSSMPLLTMLIAHVVLADDRMTRQRILGLLVGFVGVLVLTLRDLSGDVRLNLLAQGAMLLAVLFYAGSSVYARRNTQGISPIVQALVPLLVADAVIWVSAFTIEAPVLMPGLALTWVALVWLGLVGSCLAYLLYYYLIHSIGPTRTSMVTYVFPVVGITLGVFVLPMLGYPAEQLDINLVLGTILILGSVLLVNRPAPPQAAATTRV